MIGSLRGTLLERHIRGDGKDVSVDVLIEAGGVGYRLIMAANAANQLGALGSSVFAHVHTHVREDAIILFGFAHRDERTCFSALISAHGVGPSVALAILSIHSPSELMRIVHDSDSDALCSVPGIGKKTATRLMIELQSKLDVPILDIADAVNNDMAPDPRSEVRTALSGLGYSSDEIRTALSNLADSEPENLLREALRRLAVSQ